MTSVDFSSRHIGPDSLAQKYMLKTLGYKAMDDLLSELLPKEIRLKEPLKTGLPMAEEDALACLREKAKKNTVLKSWIGQGYYNTHTPQVIQRLVLENPGWYTQYTPYQPEISQGRLESLFNFQTMITELTGLAVANASLLDEASASAEAMFLCYSQNTLTHKKTFFVDDSVHPQTLDVLRTRSKPLGLTLTVGGDEELRSVREECFGAMFAYPNTKGVVRDFTEIIKECHSADIMTVLSTDLLALCLLKSPADMGADIAVGSSQRFGVPLGFGGPHAAFFATKEAFVRRLPGRVVGLSQDVTGNKAYRLALQTREQHIRREKATSNICTAQALLANMASFYGIYHGPDGLKKIATRVLGLAQRLQIGLYQAGLLTSKASIFDTVYLPLDAPASESYAQRARTQGMNLRVYEGGGLSISLDETTTLMDVEVLLTKVFEVEAPQAILRGFSIEALPKSLQRTGEFLTQKVFHAYRSETELMRYIKRLEAKDLSLTTSMIPLGSCTMKLNSATEMLPVSWSEFAGLHPFVPVDQARGYVELIQDLERMLEDITGFDAVSVQPNSGAQGEYAGLLAIHAYHDARGESHRRVCLIPSSAHGTNPASAAMVGYEVVVVGCDPQGNIDLKDLTEKAELYAKNLAALMLTYPSTHGVFEDTVIKACEAIHRVGGQVYLDGANMNAQVGLSRPGDYGADVCHLNLHKTFCIPHGGGGPGVGPIGVKSHLAKFLPGHVSGVLPRREGAVTAAPWGSAGILVIPWLYLKLMGAEGLRQATEAAILNANYLARRLSEGYAILFKGKGGLVAHECIIDTRGFKAQTGIEVADIAKRLMDYGFHAPTVSFPVVGTLMIEPTESESKEELDRFAEAMLAIREEIRQIELGHWPIDNNPLKHAPHTPQVLAMSAWQRPYSREEAVFPMKAYQKATQGLWRDHKYWPSVGRIQEAYGDRNFMCSCPPWQ